MIGKTILHYKILAKLGEGGMGVVYKAEDTKLKREVAIKFLPRRIAASEEERARFKIEAQAAAALNHPNIATIHAIEEVDDEIFIVMEYIHGQELKELIAAGPLAIALALDFAMQIADGLHAAHEKGIMHRDIKPANIMIADKDRIKIMDFGLAKMAESGGITKAGLTVGTIAYMSPEQGYGDAVDHRTDIWALGVVLYEMLAGQRPFRGEYEQAVIYAILNMEPAPLTSLRRDVPPELERIVNQALAKRAENRYQSVAAFRGNLQNLALEEKSEAPQRDKNRATKSSSPSRAAVPERRQITVMSCDLDAVSAHSEELDPETLHAVLPSYHDLCAKVISRFEGYIAQQLGDGLLVYFGYPQAYENDVQRAVHAGLGILEGLKWMTAHLEKEKGIKLTARIGIHTGVVVVSEKSEGAGAVVGETPSIAIQLQNFADADAIVVSQPAFRLIEGYFDCHEIGQQAVKGLAQPLILYQVLHESAARSRLEASARTGWTPLVGREKEVGLLQERWEQAVESNGQVVLLSGEAGIGKSRLVHELKAQVACNPEAWLTECLCSPYHQSSALYPIIDIFERVVLQFKREEAAPEKLRKIEGLLAQYGMSLPETVPLFAALLSVPLGEKYPPLNLTPERQKQKTLNVLVTILLERAARQPVLFVVEDLHWADPTSLELINLIIESGPATKLLILLTFRPEFAPPWAMRSHFAYITLNRLPRQAAEAMIGRVTRGKPLPKAVQEHIASKSDGVPLYVEEMTKMIVESDLLKERDDKYELTGALAKLAIPATLRDSLMARLDRLGAAKEVAQLGAVLGREFPEEWLQAVSPWDEATRFRELDKLVKAELLFRRGISAQTTYIFKHALIQETAYESLLKSQRQQYHQQIGETLAKQFPQTAETSPELLAHHYTNAGMKKEAIDYWQRAGQRAMARSANLEAARHLAKGLELLNTFPESLERMQQELALQLTYGMANMATKGYTSPEVEQAFARAREICTQFGETPQLFPVLWGLWAFYIVRRDFQASHELGAQLLTLSKAQQDAALLLVAHAAQGLNFFYSNGDFATARQHFEQGLGFYDSQLHRSLANTYIQDPAIVCRSHLCWILWYQGYPDQALRQSEEAIKLAKEVGHLFSLGYAKTWTAALHILRGDAPAAEKMSDEVIALATEQVFPFWLADGEMIRGWALAQQGKGTEGLEQLRRGIATWKAMGASLWQTQQLGLLAESNATSGQIPEGLAAINEALTAVDQSNERYYEGELNRLKGELLLMSTPPEEKQAETCFLRAQTVACERGAKSLELRAVMSLCRLRKKQGKTTEAQKMLTEIYHWFTEGLDTADLQAAKALLGEFG